MTETWELRFGFFIIYVGLGLLATHDLGVALLIGGAGYLVLVYFEAYRRWKKERGTK